MKKITALFLTVMIAFSTALLCSAESKMKDGVYSYMPLCNGKDVCMIENDYYKTYYNELLEFKYAHNPYISSPEGITKVTLDALHEGEFTYITVVLKEKQDDESYYDYNTAKLGEIFSEEEMLYVADKVPMAVVKLEYDKKDALKNNEAVEMVANAFFKSDVFIADFVGDCTMGKVSGSVGKVTANDARTILRFAAGFHSVAKEKSKQFYFCADMNFDGHITSADARMALRTAVGLEDTQKISFGYSSDWNDFSANGLIC